MIEHRPAKAKLLGRCRLCGKKLVTHAAIPRRRQPLDAHYWCADCPYAVEYSRLSELRLFTERWTWRKQPYTLMYFRDTVERVERPAVFVRPAWTRDIVPLVSDDEVYHGAVRA